MKKFLSYCLVCLCLTMGVGFLFALFELDAIDEIKSYFNNEKLSYLEEDWKYIVDGQVREIDLPGMLILPEGTKEVELFNTIPKDVREGDVFRLQIPFGWHDIYIDGKLRASHGNSEVTSKYVIENSATMLAVKLSDDDAGKEVCIKKGSIYLYWLVQQKAPSVSSHRDLLMSDIIESGSGLIIIIFSLIATGILFVIYGLFLFKGRNYLFLLGSAMMLFVLVIYYNTCSYYRFEFSQYSPAIPMSNDFIYYMIQYLISPIGYVLLLYIWRNVISKELRVFIIVHICLAIGTMICQMLWIDVLYFMEIVLGWMTFIGYIWMFWVIKPYRVYDSRRWFLYTIFACEIAVLLDFYKSVREVFPLPKSVVEYLQVELSFMIFLPAALIVSSIFVFIGVVNMLIEERNVLENDAKVSALMVTLGEKEYERAMENMVMIRRVKHDMNHHLTSLRALIAGGEVDEAIKYIDSATNMIPKKIGLDGNFITNGFIDYYGSLCEEANIEFRSNIQYNEAEISDKTDLGIVLGNTLKNAYEGVIATNDKLRFVEIVGRRVHDQIVIVVKNGYVNEIKANFESSKGKGRGIGISSVRAVTEGKGGFLDINTDNNTFTVKAVILIKE